MMSLNDMALFVEVGRALSFKKASKVTGMANSTISRRIHRLEKSVGLRLFNRSTRNVELTEAGHWYFLRCKSVIDGAKEAHEQFQHEFSEPRGLLRASLPVDFTTTYIAPYLAEFCSLYPKITFEFELSSKAVDMGNGYYDFAIRVGLPNSPNLHTHLLCELPLHLYASPQYIEAMGEPKSPEALMQRECLTIIYKHWDLYKGDKKVSFEAKSRFNLNSLGMVRKLVALGMGVALMPDDFVRDEVSQGELVRIMCQWRGMSAPVYAITESELQTSTTKTFIDFLTRKLIQNHLY